MTSEATPTSVNDIEKDIEKDVEKTTRTTTMHTEDVSELEDDEEGVAATSWSEVFTMCCVHSPKEWGFILLHFLAVLFFLYWFIFALELLGTGAKVLTGCVAGGLFSDDTNPVAGVIIGMLVTVLLQSSSTTTSIIVSMVGSDAIGVKVAIYMVMGANIGTSVTNTIVALGQLGDGDELERAFAGATVHDMFNFLSVGVLFPVELITGYLWRITEAMTKNYEPGDGETGGGIKVIISPILDRIVISNSAVMKDIATGKYPNCDVYYPTYCVDGEENYQNCNKDGKVGLISCSKDYGYCPFFFSQGATQNIDTISGFACLTLGIILLMMCLGGLVMVLKRMLLGASTRVIHKATSFNGYISMLIGCGLTIAVQSSSVTTSVLTPLVGVGLVTLEQMYPFTLGANIGTTVTGILAAAVASSAASMQVALAHLFFNLSGILIWYPLPFMRIVPLNGARGLGAATRWWRGFPVLYIAVAFFLIPIILLGISSLFNDKDKKGNVTFGIIIVITLFLVLCKFFWFWFRKDGKAITKARFEHYQKNREVQREVLEEFRPLKEDVKMLKEHTGFSYPEDEQEDSNGDNNMKDDKNEVEVHEA